MPEKKYFTTQEAAELLRLSPGTLQNWRCQCVGVAYRKLRGRVVYDVVDLQKFADNGLRQTSDSVRG